jgi:hypothetical protein
MSGNDRIILQERDLHLLRELSAMRVVDREQAKIVAGFVLLWAQSLCQPDS